MDSLAALRLQIEWGADEALDEAPVDRMAARTPISKLPNMLLPERLAVPQASAKPVVATPAQRAREAASAAQTRSDLRAALEAFDGCGLSATATSLPPFTASAFACGMRESTV